MKQQKITILAGLLLLLAACDSPAGTVENTEVATKKVLQSQNEVIMYKSPTCECCTGWAEHLRHAGFKVVENKREDMATVKSEYGVPDKLASCHTALIGGYIIEGHVPAVDVERLLKERPNVAGLTAPGMPMKSPGMQAVGQKPRGYDVLSFTKNGQTNVFKHYE